MKKREKKASEILRDALAFLTAAPGRWRKGDYCTVRGGKATHSDVRAASKRGVPCSACAMGAIWVAETYVSTALAERALSEAVGGDCVEEWNDKPERKLTDVKRAFRKAIRIAEKWEAA